MATAELHWLRQAGSALLLVSCAKQSDLCALSAADMRTAMDKERNAAAVSEECRAFTDVERCYRWREVDARWRAKYETWTNCP